MATLLIEYRIRDYAGWKAVFDQDSLERSSHGVTGHRIYRGSNDHNHLMLSLDFPSAEEAELFLMAVRPVWDMSGIQQAWVLREAEAATY